MILIGCAGPHLDIFPELGNPYLVGQKIAPELLIVKRISDLYGWRVEASANDHIFHVTLVLHENGLSC